MRMVVLLSIVAVLLSLAIGQRGAEMAKILAERAEMQAEIDRGLGVL